MKRLSRKYCVAEYLIEKVLAIRYKTNYCMYQTYSCTMESIHNVYIKYITGESSIQDILDILEQCNNKYRYIKYKCSNQKLSITLCLDSYELLLLDSDSEYEFEASYEDIKFEAGIKILRDFKFLCAPEFVLDDDAMKLFRELVDNQLRLKSSSDDSYNRFRYVEIFSESNPLGNLLVEQAKLSYIIYIDLIAELDFTSVSTGYKLTLNDIKSYMWNDMDWELVKLGSRYFYKIIDGIEIPIWYIDKEKTNEQNR